MLKFSDCRSDGEMKDILNRYPFYSEAGKSDIHPSLKKSDICQQSQNQSIYQEIYKKNKAIKRADPVIIGDRIRNLRFQSELTQKELAREICISQSAVSRLESGTRLPSRDTLLNLSSLFNTTADELFRF